MQCLDELNIPYDLVVQNEHISFRSHDKITIVKLHGDRRQTRPEDIIITKNDYFTSNISRRLIWDWLKIELLRNTILFLGYSLSDPDFNQLQIQLIKLLGKENLPQSYAVMFGVNKTIKADLESRNIRIIDLGDKKGEEVSNKLLEFLKILANRIKQFPTINPEFLTELEANEVVPIDIRNAIKLRGYQLIGSIQYHTYCRLFDEGEFFKTPPNWKPQLPMIFRNPKFTHEYYTIDGKD